VASALGGLALAALGPTSASSSRTRLASVWTPGARQALEHRTPGAGQRRVPSKHWTLGARQALGRRVRQALEHWTPCPASTGRWVPGKHLDAGCPPSTGALDAGCRATPGARQARDARKHLDAGCPPSTGALDAGGGGLRKELAEWRGVAVTVGQSRRDSAKA
ncbi:unnamed protein product, partial [Effrenium voratum]